MTGTRSGNYENILIRRGAEPWTVIRQSFEWIEISVLYLHQTYYNTTCYDFIGEGCFPPFEKGEMGRQECLRYQPLSFFTHHGKVLLTINVMTLRKGIYITGKHGGIQS